ncbi:VOC family protein [Candidimonas nitroreducens]|uniref:Glyoxalase n=1 Tax=Candidimonas nitroreducens TaxID=683354 RepID=A0A225M815_9BURK|nr:VOC family protein [Candidimonas nitroreducens]OWT57474.1 glyoxalase [Candidimonas nitroreducens]
MSPDSRTAGQPLVLQGLHHVAYRCKDAAQTVEFYTNVLGLTFAHSVKVDTYKGEYCPYIHVFFRMADGSYIAFFDLPCEPEMGGDPNTPGWVQHLSLRVDNEEALQEAKRRLQARGIEVDGPRTGYTVRSLYFYDPSGNRLELSVPLVLNEVEAQERAKADLDAWNAQKKELSSTRRSAQKI